MEIVSRRKFVATAAVAGAASFLRVPAFGFEDQGSVAGSAASPKALGREMVASQAVHFR